MYDISYHTQIPEALVAVARGLNNIHDPLALVAMGLHDLCSCATPVMPELGGKGRRKTPSYRSSTVPSRSTRSPVRDTAAPPVATRLPT
jgi:hypothetical protein